MSRIVYFSSASGNTHRFVERLELPATRIPLHWPADGFQVDEDHVLIVPTYGGGNLKGAVPKQVIRFLNDPHNRNLTRGVIAGGNTNFGAAYCLAGDIISAKLQVPLLFRFELLGTTEDVRRVREGVLQFWQRDSRIPV
ncbi:MAG TPA: class Ib ribonucleoside-diphosphate reductase assembly flavoprotein NrdI [Actinomycetaceae bacterium]|nr:class Ib ribonucleoside-diphosphate reductase assembly flavoprotein NrdI [Actinomycetaceae bacterium]